MATEFDSQLIESVAVRRSRLADALLYADNPTERRWRATARLFLFSIVAAALVAAICVAVAFVGSLLSDQRREQEQRERQSASAPARAADPYAPIHRTGV